MNLLITGGAGFIGSNLVALAIESGHNVVTLDALTYAGSLENLQPVASSSNHLFIKGNICDRALVESILTNGFNTSRFDVVINCAAETHVDRSLSGASIFANSNVLGTATLLEASRSNGVPVFVQVSTDEVYGSADNGEAFTTESPIVPSSPYSSSKAGADLFALSFFRSFNYDVRITRCTNNYGPYQHPEKFIPTIISSVLAGKSIPVYGDGMNVRDWLYVRDHCIGILAVAEKGSAGNIYHFGGSNEIPNIELCKTICKVLATELAVDEAQFLSLITYVKDRPGHDKRYALDCTNSKELLGWKPLSSWEEGLQQTIRWYLSNEQWWKSRLA